MKFDLQRFGGKGGVTYETTAYEPTTYELKLQELQSSFVEEIMPNAKLLNTAAKTLLLGSIGDDPLDFAAHLDEAHKRYNEAYANLYLGAEWISNYLVEVDNRSGDFETANTDYVDGLTKGWSSEFFKDENGNAIGYPGFFDCSAHMLYDHAEVAMDEIATTLRTVANGVHTHFHDIVSSYQEAQDETRLLYQRIIESEDVGTTFENVARDNKNSLKSNSSSLQSSAKNYDSDTKNLPIKSRQRNWRCG